MLLVYVTNKRYSNFSVLQLIPLSNSELVSEAILEGEMFVEVPPRVEYKLTRKGQELIESISNLLEWM